MDIKEQIKQGKDIEQGTQMPKVPFRSYTTDEERAERPADKYGRPISVRLNDEERAWLNEIKEDLGINSDSRALKVAAMAGKNVLQTMFTRKILRYLFKKKVQKEPGL